MSMTGVVVEIFGLHNKTQYNNKRGIIQKKLCDTPLKYLISIDETSIEIDNQNLKKVFCLGIPNEYYYFISGVKKYEVLISVLNQIQSSKFYVFVKDNDNLVTAFVVNVHFFELALNKMQTEPLLRIYAADTSHNTSNILFSQHCLQPCKKMQQYPWYIDLTSDFLLTLISRFNDNRLDAQQLRNMNVHDELKLHT